jgi:hypothetical protein
MRDCGDWSSDVCSSDLLRSAGFTSEAMYVCSVNPANSTTEYLANPEITV